MDEGNRVIGRRNEVVERPRLTKLLDQTEAPVVLLIAPAGYGKTTLARQWLSGRRAAWYRATSSASDAAALIAGLAARDIVPDFGERALARLGAGFPGADAASLAHVLREDLADWPSDDWLVIDDYQFVAQSRDTDALIGTIADASRLNLLITSRVRPAWATARKILYGEVFELGHQLLAMDVNEARAVMAHAGRDPVAGLVALAAGWPAVIGMAAASTATDVPEDVLEDRLYEFFASEVLESLHADTRGALAEIAIAPEPTLSVVH